MFLELPLMCSIVLKHFQIMDTPQETRPTFEELRDDPFFDE